MNKATSALLEELNITSEQLDSSMMSLIEQGFQQHIMMLGMASQQRIKEHLPATKNVD